ncbi:MAG TPA: Atxe2 family lasso peptide isopeptidase [Sphingomicrobium sp.]|nr:Atxe2 family lasso peptide isopeptidase [Sphingomicrobium sp.]
MARLLGKCLLLGAVTVAGPAAHAGPSVRQIVEIADIESLSVSPDGRLAAFRIRQASIDRNSYQIDWYVADLESGHSVRVADGGTPIYNDGILESEPAVWSPDSRYLFRRALVDRAIGLWRTTADGSGNRLEASGDSDVERVEAGKDGRSLVYVTGPSRDSIERAEREEYDNGVLVDRTVDVHQSMFRGGFVHGRLASQRLVGRWYQRDGLLWRSPRIRHSIDLVDGSEGPQEPEPAVAVEPLTASGAVDDLTAVSVGGDVATARGDGDVTLEIRRKNGAIVRCARPDCTAGKIVSIAWRPGRDELLFTRQDLFFRQDLFAFAPASGRVRRIANKDGLLNGGRRPSLPCAIAQSAAVCVSAGPASPPRLERIDLDSGRRTILFDPNAALRQGSSPIVEHLEWKLPDGRTTTGILLLPKARPSKAPLFVAYYYCPGFLRGGAGDEFPMGPLADAGFVVACANMVPFKAWGDGVDHYRTAQASIEALVDLLGRRGWIDRARIGMAGFSAGSEAAMWIAVNSGLLAAAGVSSPTYEPAAYWAGAISGKDNPRVIREFMQAGPPDQDPDRWKLIAPALNAGRIKAPLLMQVPEQEARYATELYARLGATTTPVELYAFPDEGHLKVQPRHQFAVQRRYLDWFRYWLQGAVDPDPGLAPQYNRWDELRRRKEGSFLK